MRSRQRERRCKQSPDPLPLDPAPRHSGAPHLFIWLWQAKTIAGPDGLRRRALRLQERVGYPVAESQQAGPGQCYRQGAAPPDGVG